MSGVWGDARSPFWGAFGPGTPELAGCTNDVIPLVRVPRMLRPPAVAAAVVGLRRPPSPSMPETYLQTAYKDSERVKGLGARWDPARKQWYVPEGRDVAPFVPWLPAEHQTGLSTLESTAGTELTLPTKGVSLSQLLAGVAQAVAQVYRAGEWVRVEVVKADVRRGHIYLELTERSPAGDALAQARAMIWADTANQIVTAFERATGVVLGAGIKLLLRAKPTFSAQYGLSLTVDAIDPDYTLGDLDHPTDGSAHPSGGVGRGGGFDLPGRQRRRFGRGPRAEATAGRGLHLSDRLRTTRRPEGADAPGG